MLTKTICIELLATAASATQYFGSASPDSISTNLIQTNSRIASNDISIDYAYYGDMYGDEEFGNFLKAANVTSGLAYDRYTGSNTMETNATIIPRAETLCNAGSKLSIKEEINYNVCNVFANLVGAGPGAVVAAIASGVYCADSTTGLQTNCNLIWIFTGASGGGITNGILQRYCPLLLAAVNNDCADKGGDASEGEYDLLEDVSQTDHQSCDEVTVPCQEINP